MLDQSVTLDGDRLAALNPPPANELECLHRTLALVVHHQLSQGYDRFIINHFWSTRAEIAAFEAQLEAIAATVQIRCFRLVISREENLRRIARRQVARAIDEADFEKGQFVKEYAVLSKSRGTELGAPFDASDPPEVLARRLAALLDLPSVPSGNPTGSA